MRAIAKVTSPVPLRYVLFLVVLGMLAAALTAGPMLSPGRAESAFPGANGKIAFASSRDGNGEIYVMNADGSAQTNLTNSPAEDRDPAWSPDGTRIAFASTRDGGCGIYVMNADGSGVTQLTSNPYGDYWPGWSPDGSKVAFSRSVIPDLPWGADIYVINADGSGQTNVTNNGLGNVLNWDPAWSPDGSKIAFSRGFFGGDSEVYVMKTDGSAQTNLTNNPGALDWDPTWSPDGSKIAYEGRAGVYNAEIFVMDADGANKQRLTFTADFMNDSGPAWSPDGTKIAFVTDRDIAGKGQIYLMNVDGSAQTKITNSLVYEGPPDWQPLPVLAPTSTSTATPSPTRTPTPITPHPPGVGGTVKLPPAAVAAESGASAEGSGWTVGAYAALAGSTIAVASAAWYARRRWMR